MGLEAILHLKKHRAWQELKSQARREITSKQTVSKRAWKSRTTTEVGLRLEE